MKYCLKYTNKSTKLNRADEITIKYIEDKGLVDFMEKFNKQKMNLLIDAKSFSNGEIRKLVAIKKQYPEYKFAIAMKEYDDDCATKLKKVSIPFYVASPCKNWEEFMFLIVHGVSEINISGPLAFEMSKVKRVLNSLNQKVTLRATPNKVENINEYTNTLIGFYIRPEDTELYEDFIDVFEFEGLTFQDTFFSIYAEQKTFIGNLNQCIYDFKEQVDNKGLVSLFGERRRDCGRQCLNGGLCRRCYTLANIAKPAGEKVKGKIVETVQNNIEQLQKIDFNNKSREELIEEIKKEQERRLKNGKDLSD